MTRHTLKAALLAGATAFGALPATAETNLTMYYPIAVGGALTQVVDGLIAEFHEANPDIRVNAIYAGNYDDTRVRVLSAIASGESAPLSVLFSIDALDLIEQEMIIPFDDVVETDEEREWLDSFYPGLMANGRIEGHVAVNALINSVKLIDHLFILTKGGPSDASKLVLYYIWELAFSYFDRPQAAALTVIVLLVLGVVATVKFTFLDRRTHYQ